MQIRLNINWYKRRRNRGKERGRKEYRREEQKEKNRGEEKEGEDRGKRREEKENVGGKEVRLRSFVENYHKRISWKSCLPSTQRNLFVNYCEHKRWFCSPQPGLSFCLTVASSWIPLAYPQ